MRYMEEPLLTSVLGEEMLEAAQTPKPTARGTRLRYSAAHACQRQQSYAALQVMPTEPVDFAGAWVMGMGTLVHEALQEAIGRRFPGAEFEVASMHGSHLSGSCDALLTGEVLANAGFHNLKDSNVLYELKTMGSYSFDKQVGWNRMRAQITNPEGPALKAIAQAGMNALGIEAERGIHIDYVVMGSITFEALSKQKADRMGISDSQRVMAEFWLDRSEWLPLAQAELERMENVASFLDRGYLAPTFAVGDEGEEIFLSSSSNSWQCTYCSFRSVCNSDGPGILSINDSVVAGSVQKEGE